MRKYPANRRYPPRPTKRRRPTYEVFDSHVKKDEGGCWLWVGTVSSSGYGTFWNNEICTNMRAHRFAYERFKGQIPKGLCVCHSCDNPRCVNPDHLWLGTISDNTQDMHDKGRGFLKTHCKKGHPFTGKNAVPRGKRARVCRECRNERVREFRARQRGSA